MKILDLIFPPKCVFCGDILEYGVSIPFCDVCQKEWKKAKANGDNENFDSGALYNYRCMPMGGGLYAAYLFEYSPNDRSSVGNSLIYNLKNSGSSLTVDFVASEFARIIRESASFVCDVDSIRSASVITWVPRSKRTKSHCGFDHMERCAKALASKIGVQAKELIVKTFGSMEQKHLPFEERYGNASKSMFLKKNVRVDYGTVILIDDIITTGASVNTAVELLQKSGARQIIVITLAATSHSKRKNGISLNI